MIVVLIALLVPVLAIDWLLCCLPSLYNSERSVRKKRVMLTKDSNIGF